MASPSQRRTLHRPPAFCRCDRHSNRDDTAMGRQTGQQPPGPSANPRGGAQGWPILPDRTVHTPQACCAPRWLEQRRESVETAADCCSSPNNKNSEAAALQPIQQRCSWAAGGGGRVITACHPLFTSTAVAPLVLLPLGRRRAGLSCPLDTVQRSSQVVAVIHTLYRI